MWASPQLLPLWFSFLFLTLFVTLGFPLASAIFSGVPLYIDIYTYNPHWHKQAHFIQLLLKFKVENLKTHHSTLKQIHSVIHFKHTGFQILTDYKEENDFFCNVIHWLRGVVVKTFALHAKDHCTICWKTKCSEGHMRHKNMVWECYWVNCRVAHQISFSLKKTHYSIDQTNMFYLMH